MFVPRSLLPRACPVCIKVINDIKAASAGKKALEDIETSLQKVCSKAATTQEKKLVRRGVEFELLHNSLIRVRLCVSPAVLLH